MAPSASDPAAPGYPSLRTVPPRPRLTYPVEQRREIAEGLISDRANARYTAQWIRYRTGRAEVPPSPPPAVTAAEVDAVVGAPPPAADPAAVVDDMEEFATVRRGGLGGADIDDDSLGDFIREMVRETAPGGRDELDLQPLPPRAGAAGPELQPPVTTPEAAARPGAAPASPSEAGALAWLGGLFSGRAAASEEADGTAAEQDEAPAGPATPQAAGETEVPPAVAAPGSAAAPPAPPLPPLQPAPSPPKPGFVEVPPPPPPEKPRPGSSGSLPGDGGPPVARS